VVSQEGLGSMVLITSAHQMDVVDSEYKKFNWKSKEKRPFGRHGCRCKDNIKMYLKEIG
jgi:hypothetical protein